MKFNNYIQKILESLIHIPAFDGYREVYGYCSSIGGDELFRRFTEDELEYWDNWKDVYVIPNEDGVIEPMDNFGSEFTDREEFFRVISKEAQRLHDSYSDMKQLPQVVKAMQENISADLPGVYRYFGNHDHGDFWWGFEVNVPKCRIAQINNDLQGVDTTGLEDLM